METIQDIFYAELKNLYALEKQTQEMIESLQDEKTSKSVHKSLKSLKAASLIDIQAVREILRQCQLNPGNTKDAVAEQMLDNIRNIYRLNIPSKLKEKGLYASLLRLSYYKTACYRATQNLAKTIGSKEIKESLKEVRKSTEDYSKNINKLSKKKLDK